MVKTSPQKLAQAQHQGWLAANALLLQCATEARNPFIRDSEEWFSWRIGFEQGST